jgi:hypothetical protein
VLQRAAQCCNELHSVATSCTALQRVLWDLRQLLGVPLPALLERRQRLDKPLILHAQHLLYAVATMQRSACAVATMQRSAYAVQPTRCASRTRTALSESDRRAALRCAAAHLGRVGRELLELLGPDLKPQRRTCVCVFAPLHIWRCRCYPRAAAAAATDLRIRTERRVADAREPREVIQRRAVRRLRERERALLRRRQCRLQERIALRQRSSGGWRWASVGAAARSESTDRPTDLGPHCSTHAAQPRATL